MKRKTENQLLAKIAKEPKYQGKQIAILGNQIHVLSTKSKKAREELLISLVKKYPKATPVVAFVPKENAFILSL